MVVGWSQQSDPEAAGHITSIFRMQKAITEYYASAPWFLLYSPGAQQGTPQSTVGNFLISVKSPTGRHKGLSPRRFQILFSWQLTLNVVSEVGVITPGLRAHTALTKDSSLVPSTHSESLQPPVISALSDPSSLSWFPRALHSQTHNPFNPPYT